MNAPARYDAIGCNYARYRREDPALRAAVRAALSDAKSVANVGAGAGSYEPPDLHVVAIEPSDLMASQRPRGLAPAIRASAGALPLRDAAVDAAMAVVTIHHWDEELEAGLAELDRVARDRVVILTYDAVVSAGMWLMADYLPEVAAMDLRIFPSPSEVAARLSGRTRIETLPLSRDTPDWMLGSYWAHPERVLDAGARAATSGFARMPPEVVDRVVAAVGADLASGAWDRRHGHLRGLPAFDVGLRLIVAEKR